MNIPVVPIGNSRGIRIPKKILDELKIQEKVDLTVEGNEIHIRPIQNTVRSGWPDAFARMHDHGDDESLIPETNDPETFEWEW